MYKITDLPIFIVNTKFSPVFEILKKVSLNSSYEPYRRNVDIREFNKQYNKRKFTNKRLSKGVTNLYCRYNFNPS